MNQALALLNQNNLKKAVEAQATVILFSGSAPKKSADIQYPFEVNRNFYYVTGIDEPHLIYVLHQGKSLLFIEEADELYEKWVGKKIDQLTANFKSGIEHIFYLDIFYAWLEKNVTAENPVYLDLEVDQFNQCPTTAAKALMQFGLNYEIKDINPILTQLRMIKSEREIKAMQEAIKITQAGLENVLKNMVPAVRESHYEADFDYILKQHNVRHAFDSIVASGENATVLHYVTNNHISQANDLVLFDLGATYQLYCADISRTFPVSGKFTPRQKEIYNIVLMAQEKMLAAVKPGVSLPELNRVVVDYYAEALTAIGLIKTKEEVARYYYHNVSHLLGLDTHDVGGREVVLKPGMVITCEPGLYIKEEAIGIRVEDNILVTETGYQNLSSDIIKTVADIEAFMEQHHAQK